MIGPKLSDWHLQSAAAVATIALIGVLVVSYLQGSAPRPLAVGQTVAVSAQWNGATADRVSTYVTLPIERKLADIEALAHTQSLTEAGRTTVYITADETSSDELAATWLLVRSLMQEVSATLPKDVTGPFLITNFKASDAKLLAFTADGMNQGELTRYVDALRPHLQLITGAGRVDLLGAGEQSFFIDFFNPRLEMLSIQLPSVLKALHEQHGLVSQPTDNSMSIRVRDTSLAEAEISNLTLKVNSLYIRLSDVADIRPDYSAAPTQLLRFDGRAAIGVVIATRSENDVSRLTAALEATASQLNKELPSEVSVALIPYQPELVSDAMSGFMKALFGVLSKETSTQ